MKKAVIATGGKQYLVKENETLNIELIKGEEKNITFDPLLVIDEDKTVVGTPFVKDAKVSAEVTDREIKADKVTAIRYKAKKRVHKLQGHRQRYTAIKISKITSK